VIAKINRFDRTRRALFVLLFASYAYFYQAGGWNQNSRFDLVRAITNEHTLNIDPFRLSTGDIAFFDGHYYSDKAPGIAFTAVPVVALVRPILHAFGGDPETYAGLALLSYLATVFTAGLFTALAGVCLYTLAIDLGASGGGALFAAFTFGLATPIWTLATIFIGHAFGAALLVFAFAAALRVGTVDASRDVRLGATVGLAAGWATISEFPAAIPAVLLALVTAMYAWPLGRGRAIRILGALAAGALASAAVLMVYQYACFGSPFHIAYTSEQGYEGMQQGVFGVMTPKMIRLRGILFGDYRGLLPLAPTLAVAPIGLALMLVGRTAAVDAAVESRFLRARRPVAAIVAAFIAVYFLLLNASYVYWEGGWSYGPRHASPSIPFLCLGLATLWTSGPRVVRWALVGLSAYGCALTLVAVSTMPLPPVNIHRPVTEFLWPAFRDGDLALNTQTMVARGVDLDFRAHHEPKAAFNLGMKLGLRGHLSLVPLALVWIGCAFILIRSARRDDNAPA
jgi:MFS family permease